MGGSEAASILGGDTSSGNIVDSNINEYRGAGEYLIALAICRSL